MLSCPDICACLASGKPKMRASCSPLPQISFDRALGPKLLLELLQGRLDEEEVARAWSAQTKKRARGGSWPDAMPLFCRGCSDRAEQCPLARVLEVKKQKDLKRRAVCSVCTSSAPKRTQAVWQQKEYKCYGPCAMHKAPRHFDTAKQLEADNLLHLAVCGLCQSEELKPGQAWVQCTACRVTKPASAYSLARQRCKARTDRVEMSSLRFP